ncbi:MAG TPA: glycine--tRNA ligase subunit beta [Burkholderiaceae bacterium]|nr:glycine--tRNA ligase subunit beta [Burkholderiaceae bacterium]
MPPDAASGAAASAPLLVELFTEELPPRALKRLGDAFCEGIVEGLRSRGLAAEGVRVDGFATPRRLAARVAAVAALAPDRSVEVKGPSVKVGLDAAGVPTQALLKWAAKQSAPIESLTRASDGKQECFWHRSTVRGESLDAVIDAVIEQALSKLPIPKAMQYQLADGRTTVSFVRPVHGLLVLHGARLLEASVLGLRSGRATHGHRFQSEGPIEIADANVYEEALETRGRVLASFDARRARIESMLRGRSAALGASLGDEAQVATLLDEVTALVEWPAVYVGEFEREFLQVPQECLILTMRTNQKYFPLFEPGGRLLPKFLIVSNMEVDDPRFIVDGNQRVVRPRLADARFFFEQDKKTTLAARVGQLGSVVYHAKLGSQGERVERVRSIARDVATLLHADGALADRAALLAKADLLTGMVGEFPELQGVMGTYYARHDGEPEAVARAITEQYQPRFAGDALPATEIGTVLALADKLETLAGLFGIGQQPTGDKDPFALRRHALGVIRMLVEHRLELPLNALVDAAFRAFGDRIAHAHAELETFFYDRLGGYLRERGFAAQEIAAVVDQRPAQLALVPAQLDAVREFSKLPEAQALAAANKRIVNILKKAGDGIGSAVDRTLFAEPAERALADRIAELKPQVDARMVAADFTGAMTLMAQAREPVDRFFDDVMVMADDPQVRANRLALLSGLRHLMNQVADISKLSSA